MFNMNFMQQSPECFYYYYGRRLTASAVKCKQNVSTSVAAESQH